jgi:hypothetical protein
VLRTATPRHKEKRKKVSPTKRRGISQHAPSEPSKHVVAKSAKIPNHELVVVAAFLAGAQSRLIDTEDIAIKANELAPGRFTWRKYKDQINIETVRKREPVGD